MLKEMSGKGVIAGSGRNLIQRYSHKSIRITLTMNLSNSEYVE